MDNFFKFSVLLIIYFLLYFAQKTATQLFSCNATSSDSETVPTISNIWKEDSEIIKLRLENLELKQTQKFEEIQVTLNKFENHLNHMHEEENNAGREQSVVTQFYGEEEPKLCIKNNEVKLICSNVSLPTSCGDSNSINCWDSKCRIQNRLYGSKSFLINCVEQMGKTGWTTIQRRIDGSIDFNRNWTEYKNGFGNMEGNYWIGLDRLYALTTTWAPAELLIILEDFESVTKYAKYDAFAIGDESSKYLMKILGNYSGSAGNSLESHKGSKFTTFDQDNDKVERNCAGGRGGWWYNNCFNCNLNGRYFDAGTTPIQGHHDGIHWDAFMGDDYSLKSVEMLIRPKEM